MPMPDVFGLPTVALTKFGDFEIEILRSANHRFENLLTQNPVEDGSILSDHIVNQPIILEFEGRISDTPLTIFGSLAGGVVGKVASDFGANQEIATAAAFGGSAIFSSLTPGVAQQAFLTLVALWESRDTFTVVTGYRTYDDMAIEKLAFPRDRQTGRSLIFNVTLRQVRKAATLISEVTGKVSDDVQQTAPAVQNLGQQPMNVVG